MVILPCIGLAQNSSLKGQILNSSNQKALPSANVKVLFPNGQEQRLKLDSEARFSLPLSVTEKRITILITHIGYEQQKLDLSLPYVQSLRIQLIPTNSELEEVEISTGYQTLSPERATGSFEFISQAQLASRASGSVINRLDGIVPSMLFYRSRDGNLSDTENIDRKDITIRGVTSLTSDIRPLIVVDNFPYEGDIGNINPNDVESVTVLKDAAAASIWGAKAGNGVLVITTKKASLNRPFRLNATLNYLVTEKPDLFFHPTTSTSDFIDTEIYLYKEKNAYRSQLDDVRNWPVINPVIEILELERLKAISAEEVKNRIDALRKYDIRNDIDRYINRNSIAKQYYIALGGGGSLLSQQLSIGYDDNTGGTIGKRNDRLSLRSQSLYQPFKNLSLDIGIAVTQRNAEENTPGISLGGTPSSPAYAYARLADDDGNPLVLEQDYRKMYVETARDGKLLDWQYRPLEEARYLDNATQKRHLQLNVGTKYQMLSMLSAELKYNLEQGSTYGNNYKGLELYSTRNMINRFTQINGDKVSYSVPMGGILDKSHAQLTSQSFRGQLNLDQNWGSLHQINALVGSELRESRTLSNSGRTYGFDEDFLTFQFVDHVNRYPIYDNLGANILIPNTASFSGYTDRFVSFYGNGSYSYRGKYMLSASARKDASNLFGVKTNNKWKPLWSAGLSWTISEEDFYGISWLPYLRARATYGYSGNVNNSIPAVTTIKYASSPSDISRLQYATVVNAPNPGLRWEQIATTNIALDFASKSRRLSGSFEFYRKTATDLITYVPLDRSTGYIGMNMNVGSLQSQGMDIRLNSINMTGILGWHSSFYLSTNKDKVLEYFFERKNASEYVGNGQLLTAIVGKPTYPVVSYASAGLDPQTGDPRGYLEGEISTDYQAIMDGSIDNLIFHGNAMPQYLGALGNTLSYKDFSISMNVTYRLGYYFKRLSANASYLYTMPITIQHGDYYLRWQKPGDEKTTVVPSAKYPMDSRREMFFTNSSVLVEKGDHVRLQNVNFSYRISKEKWHRLPVKQMTFNIYSSNLGILWRANKKGLDPDFTTFPGRLNLSAGLNLTF